MARTDARTEAVHSVVKSVQEAVVEISYIMRRGGIWEGFGEKHGGANESGDHQESVDVLADNIMAEHLEGNPNVWGFASEERKEVNRTGHRGEYLVSYDPLDGSQNIKVNLTTGVIYGIFHCPTGDTPSNGRSLVAAGYAVFGAATSFVVASREEGVTVYTLCPSIQRFKATQRRHMIPPKGKVYACNEGLQATWSTERSRQWAEHMRGRSVRWMACMVSDAHRILMQGGGFLLPADRKSTRGKLRLVYEAYPMAFVFECAGGKALLEDLSPILDHPFPPQPDLHLKVPVFLASKAEAEVYAKL
eukprot:TRINITY_DN11875_c0_g6_i1.p2 TRINITY_DN11875_c0_g6~~TRINITY_DN11875_c0_g6_i1.p2  ORF type:complete len:304 (+),score=116.33 TRINITY_DN11875_c0_g6_i1:432-1343(+)